MTELMIETLAAMLKQHEGTGPVRGDKMFAYRCSAGKLTIGYGRNIEDNGITFGEAEFMLHNDIMDVMVECQQAFPWFDSLDDARQLVVMNMVFNMGLPTFSKFKQTIAYISQGDYDRASTEMLDSAWAKQVGNRAIHLSQIMATGEIEDARY